MLLEVIVQTVDDALAAEDGGADRLEVVRELEVGGLTPSLSLVRGIQAVTSLPLRVMVRENAGFGVGPGELPILRAAVTSLQALHVDGVVMGFAQDGEIAVRDLARVLEPTPGLRVTFHRAFDTLRSPLAAVEILAGLPQIDRVLTDGGTGPPIERSVRLAELGERARALGADLTVIAGSRVDDESLAVFAASGCVREAHVGRAARDGNKAGGRVSPARVRRLRQIADGTSLAPASTV